MSTVLSIEHVLDTHMNFYNRKTGIVLAVSQMGKRRLLGKNHPQHKLQPSVCALGTPGPWPVTLLNPFRELTNESIFLVILRVTV